MKAVIKVKNSFPFYGDSSRGESEIRIVKKTIKPATISSLSLSLTRSEDSMGPFAQKKEGEREKNYNTN